MQKFKIIGKPLLAGKYVEGKKKKNNAKFSGHYVHQRTHNIRAHALRSDQLKNHLELFAKKYRVKQRILLWWWLE